MPAKCGPTATVKRIDVLAATTGPIGSEGNFFILKNKFVTLNHVREGVDGVSGAPG